jgi:ribosomal protein S18 acetylase RimI-like enzyme
LIRPAESDADVDSWLSVRNEVFPAITLSRSALDAQDRRGPVGRLKLLADDVGFAIVTPPEPLSPHASLTAGVLEHARNRGVGTALWTAGAAHLAGLGIATARSLSIEGEAAGARFLEHRGFREVGRETAFERDLLTLPPPPPLPAGIELAPVPLDSAAFRDAYGLEVETLPDIPGEEGVEMPPFEEWVKELEAEGAALVVGARDGDELIGMAILSFPDDPPGIAWHWMTAVRASYRRRGIGRALKHASLVAAAERGATTARTFNESRNVGMRRINEEFGYMRLPGLLRWEGPCSS